MDILDPWLGDNDALWVVSQPWKGKDPNNVEQIHKTLFLGQLVSLKDCDNRLFNNEILATASGPRISDIDIKIPYQEHDADYLIQEFLDLVSEFVPTDQSELESFLQGPNSLWAKYYKPDCSVQLTLDVLLEAINNVDSEESKIVDRAMIRQRECDEALEKRLADIPIPTTGPLLFGVRQ